MPVAAPGLGDFPMKPDSGSMAKKLIFISCGQLTETEKSVGVLLKAVVEGIPGFQAYLAETVHDLDGLAHNVLEGIQNCCGAIVVLQDRGLVTQSDGKEWGRRSSVWVNQEIAILAYRQFFESKSIPILAFMDSAVKLEGAMTSLIVNALALPASAALASTVRQWLEEAVALHVNLDKTVELTKETLTAQAASVKRC
jgi:hypothetical protein